MSPSASPRSTERRRPGSAPPRSGFLLLLRDVGIAALAVVVVIGGVFAYSGTWPPMVVIESSSMQHANDRSFLGVIDTGDLTLVKKVGGDSEIVTYMQGARTGYQTYGTFGDVIIYSKNGHFELTPIIHRAIARIVYNATEFERLGLKPPTTFQGMLQLCARINAAGKPVSYQAMMYVTAIEQRDQNVDIQ